MQRRSCAQKGWSVVPCKLGCGACCAAVLLTVTLESVETMRNRRGEGDAVGGDWAHLLDHFYPISADEANRRNPHLHARVGGGFRYFGCDWYDPQTKLCTHHDERPRLCREYPFYGAPLAPGQIWYTPECGYAADVGKTQAAVAPFEPTAEEGAAAAAV